MATLSTKITIPEQVLFRDLGDEAVILALETGQYYSLDEVGATMWYRLREHGDVGSAFRALRAEYQVADDQLEQDLLELVDRLAACGLVELQEG